MHLSKAFLASALAAACLGMMLTSGGAIELTQDSFDKKVQESGDDIWLVDFYAPWCGHCKRLSPVWDQAEETIEKEGISVKLGKVDCTAHKPICKRYGATSFPTLKVLSDAGKTVKDFRGGRTAEQIVEYATRLAGPQLMELKTARELKEFVGKHISSFVYFRSDDEAEDSTLGLVKDAAAQMFDVTSIAVAPEDAADDLGIKITHKLKPLKEDEHLAGRLVNFRKEEGKCFPETRNKTVDSFVSWMDGHRGELMTKLDAGNYRDVGNRGKPLAIVVLRGSRGEKADEDGSKDEFEKIPINAEFLESMRVVARENEESFSFGYLNGKRWHKFIEQYGMSQRVLPRMLIVDAPTEYFLPVPVDVKGQRGTGEFLEKVAKGEIKMLRTWSATIKHHTKDTWHYIAAALAAVIILPIIWVFYTDYKKAEAEHKASKAAKAE